MQKSLAAAALVLSLAAAGCTCDKAVARFWEVRDRASNATCYTVDTAAVQAETIDTYYVDAKGAYVEVREPLLVRQMDEATWLAATGGASYALHYCPQRKACWAAVRDR